MRIRVKVTFQHWAGAQMLSAVVTTMLFGVAIFFVLRYLSSHSRNDPLSVKALVWILGVLAVLEVAFADHQMYRYFVLDNDAPDRRDMLYASIPGKTACIILTSFVSQLFYAARIWKLATTFNSPLRYSVVLILALSLTQLGGGMIQVVVMARLKTYTELKEQVHYTIRSMYIHGSTSAACDILITIVLVVMLRTTGVDTTRRTKNLVNKLVVYAINRGIITSFLALASILLYDFASGTMYYLIPFSAVTHVYVISVVSMLTAREGLREAMDRPFHLSDLMTTTNAGSSSKSGTGVAIFTPQPPLGAPESRPGRTLLDRPSNC